MGECFLTAYVLYVYFISGTSHFLIHKEFLVILRITNIVLLMAPLVAFYALWLTIKNIGEDKDHE